ncbi:hypothetical protein ABZS61_28665 [Streptomyces sp. NPDC005566]|uniref:hypothetical protein n=1 Tax=Streptomyces sp. NPDC005566 TaxID=3156886 RepID=UPI0033ABF985
MTAHSTPLKSWVRSRRRVNTIELKIMALRYDLDGAVEAGQHGLAWWSAQELFTFAVELSLIESGVESPSMEDPVERVCGALDSLHRVNPELAEAAWELWLRPQPSQEEMGRALDETLAFIEQRLGLPWVLSRQQAVLRWAASTSALRAVAKHLGMAASEDWYVGASDAPDLDWYSEIVATLEAESHR